LTDVSLSMGILHAHSQIARTLVNHSTNVIPLRALMIK